MAQESETGKFKFNVETVPEKSKAHTRPSGKRKSKQKVLFQGLLKYRKWIRYISNQPHDKCFNSNNGVTSYDSNYQIQTLKNTKNWTYLHHKQQHFRYS